MINLCLTVRECLNLAVSCEAAVFEKIVQGLEQAVGEDSRLVVTVTHVPSAERIDCIRLLREYTGWGLREAKEWVDVVVGWSHNQQFVEGRSNSIRLATNEQAREMLADLANLGCEAHLDDLPQYGPDC